MENHSRSHEDQVSSVDVLVVGAGPAGLFCAMALVQGGVQVKVIDQKCASLPLLLLIFYASLQGIYCYLVQAISRNRRTGGWNHATNDRNISSRLVSYVIVVNDRKLTFRNHGPE